MTDVPRYRIRAKGPAFSRLQCWIVGFATLAFVCGFILALTVFMGGDKQFVRLGLGGGLMALSGVTNSLTVQSATSRDSST
jgi:hypothetical protein